MDSDPPDLVCRRRCHSGTPDRLWEDIRHVWDELIPVLSRYLRITGVHFRFDALPVNKKAEFLAEFKKRVVIGENPRLILRISCDARAIGDLEVEWRIIHRPEESLLAWCCEPLWTTLASTHEDANDETIDNLVRSIASELQTSGLFDSVVIGVARTS